MNFSIVCTCIYFCSTVHMWMEVSVYSRTNCWISWCWNYSGKQPVWMLGSKRGPFEEQDMWWTTEPSLQPQVLYILIYSVPSHGRNKWECFKYFHMIFPVKWGSSNIVECPLLSYFVSLKETFPGPQSPYPWYAIGSSVLLSLSVLHWMWVKAAL